MNNVAALLRSHRFSFVDEAGLQDGVERLLDENGIPHVREHDLRPHGRIDFYLPDLRLGIETKTKGSPSAVARQMMGYAEHEDVARLILVTSRSLCARYIRHRLNGKPVEVVSLWESML